MVQHTYVSAALVSLHRRHVQSRRANCLQRADDRSDCTTRALTSSRKRIGFRYRSAGPAHPTRRAGSLEGVPAGDHRSVVPQPASVKGVRQATARKPSGLRDAEQAASHAALPVDRAAWISTGSLRGEASGA